jgi:hypothetical protein
LKVVALAGAAAGTAVAATSGADKTKKTAETKK